MSGNTPISAIKGRISNPVDAVKLYETTNKHISFNASNDNPFKGTVSWGLFAWNFGEVGQVDPTEYNKETGEEYHQRTLCYA